MVKNLKSDIKLRLKLQNKEAKNFIFKFINKSNYYYTLNNSLLVLIKYKVTSKTLIKNFCIISGRARSIISTFKISRIVIKKFVASNVFFNLKKH